MNDYYNDINKIKTLISLGDISRIEKNVYPDPNRPHTFGDNEQRDVTVAYHRDRSEKWKYTKPKKDKNITEFNNRCLSGWEEYAYLYDIEKEKWLVAYIPFMDSKKLKYYELKDEIKSIKIDEDKEVIL